MPESAEGLGFLFFWVRLLRAPGHVLVHKALISWKGRGDYDDLQNGYGDFHYPFPHFPERKAEQKRLGGVLPACSRRSGICHGEIDSERNFDAQAQCRRDLFL